ncbi:hypothetical protein Mapa_001184 [Marchantia paleacea]|nr:hypothetical protein Mapa_001184 [Marchantia paleacea]
MDSFNQKDYSVIKRLRLIVFQSETFSSKGRDSHISELLLQTFSELFKRKLDGPIHELPSLE